MGEVANQLQREERHTGWLTAGDMASGSGNSLRVVRHYQQLGLLRPLGRTEGGHRAFHPDELHRLRFISTLRDLGMSLKEIGEFLAIQERTERPPEAAAILTKRFDQLICDINCEIRRLRSARADFQQALHALETCNECRNVGEKLVCGACKIALNQMPEGLRALWLTETEKEARLPS